MPIKCHEFVCPLARTACCLCRSFVFVWLSLKWIFQFNSIEMSKCSLIYQFAEDPRPALEQYPRKSIRGAGGGGPGTLWKLWTYFACTYRTDNFNQSSFAVLVVLRCAWMNVKSNGKMRGKFENICSIDPRARRLIYQCGGGDNIANILFFFCNAK